MKFFYGGKVTLCSPISIENLDLILDLLDIYCDLAEAIEYEKEMEEKHDNQR